jgi:hypothetical protein
VFGSFGSSTARFAASCVRGTIAQPVTWLVGVTTRVDGMSA